MEAGAAAMQDKPLQNGCHLVNGDDDGNPPPERIEAQKIETLVKVVDDDDDPPAERLDKPTNGTSGVDSGLDKSDSSESDASSTKSDPDGGKGDGICKDSKKKDEDDDKEADVFFLPEVGFNIKIDAPGTENFEIQVSPRFLFSVDHFNDLFLI